MIDDGYQFASIVVTTFNREKYIPSLIDSVLSQTHKNFELIIIDDGSSDSTSEIVGLYGDPRVRYFFHENKGRVYSRNRGIAESKSNIVCFLDSDDLWLPSKLERQLLLMSENEADWSFGAVNDVKAGSQEVVGSRGGVITDNFLYDVVNGRVSVPMCTICVKKVFLDKYDIFDKLYVKYRSLGFEQAEHSELILKMALFGKGVAVDDVIAKYQIHEGNLSVHVSALWGVILPPLRTYIKYKGSIPLAVLLTAFYRFFVMLVMWGGRKMYRKTRKMFL